MSLGLLFVPLTTITKDPIPKEQMGNATSLFNLMRNIGGSIGIAITGRARHGTPVDDAARIPRDCLRSGEPGDVRRDCDGVHRHGSRSGDGNQPHVCRALRHGGRQASMVSFVTIFQLLGLVFIALIPLVLIMKRPKRGAPPAAAHRTASPASTITQDLAEWRLPVCSRPTAHVLSVLLFALTRPGTGGEAVVHGMAGGRPRRGSVACARRSSTPRSPTSPSRSRSSSSRDGPRAETVFSLEKYITRILKPKLILGGRRAFAENRALLQSRSRAATASRPA